MKEKIISLLEEEKRIIEDKIKQEQKQNLLPIKDYQERIERVIEDPLRIAEIDIDDLMKNINITDENQITKLKAYQGFSKSKFFPLAEEQKKYIVEFMKEAKRKIEIYIDYTLKNNEEVEKKASNISSITEIIKNIEEEKYLNSSSIHEIERIAKDKGLEIGEIDDIIIYLTLNSLKSLANIQTEEEEVIEVEETNIDEQELISLLSKYNYNYEDFNEKNKQILISFGKLNNIEEILNTLKENNIKLDIKNQSKTIANILVHSNKNIIERIISNIKEDIDNNKLNSNEGTLSQLSVINQFNEYLKHPSYFIKGTRVYAKKNPKGGPGPVPPRKPSDTISGAFDNYDENRRILKELGVDITIAMEKSGSIFSNPPKKTEKNIKNFEQYGIPKEVYLSSLSCLVATDPLSAIDQFIEVGCYDYILNNFSYVRLAQDDLIFYRIIKAKQNGETNNDLYRTFKSNTQNIEFNGKITNRKSNYYGINEQTKYESVSQYFPKFNSIYGEIVESSANDAEIIMAKDNYFIKAIEEFTSEDGLTYNFNGVLISKNKVLRMYETLIKNGKAGTVQSILYSICKNSILTEEQFNAIKTCIDKKFMNIRSVCR